MRLSSAAIVVVGLMSSFPVLAQVSSSVVYSPITTIYYGEDSSTASPTSTSIVWWTPESQAAPAPPTVVGVTDVTTVYVTAIPSSTSSSATSTSSTSSIDPSTSRYVSTVFITTTPGEGEGAGVPGEGSTTTSNPEVGSFYSNTGTDTSLPGADATTTSTSNPEIASFYSTAGSSASSTSAASTSIPFYGSSAPETSLQRDMVKCIYAVVFGLSMALIVL